MMQMSVIILYIVTQECNYTVSSGWFHTFKLIKKSRCSFTVNRSNSTLCWGQSPKLSLIASISVIILFPSMWAEPEEGGNKPVNIDIVVVFPAPLCPRRAVIWPLKMLSESSSTATLDPVDP